MEFVIKCRRAHFDRNCVCEDSCVGRAGTHAHTVLGAYPVLKIPVSTKVGRGLRGLVDIAGGSSLLGRVREYCPGSGAIGA